MHFFKNISRFATRLFSGAFFKNGNQKFIATDTANQIIGTTGLKNVADGLQRIVADQMTVSVVNKLEIIRVDVEKTDLRYPAIFYLFIEITTVIQAGQNARIATKSKTESDWYLPVFL